MVKLSRDESARAAHVGELVPDRIHRAGSHASQRAGESRDVVLQPFRPHLSDVRRPAALQPGEEGKSAPVIDERLDAIALDAFRQGLVAEPAALACAVVEPGMRADRDEREHALGTARRHVKRKPPTHRVAREVRPLDPEPVPKGKQVLGASVHRAWRARRRLRFAVAAKVGHDPTPAFGDLGDELAPAPSALREAVQQGDRRTGAGHKVAQLYVLTLQNHDSILCRM